MSSKGCASAQVCQGRCESGDPCGHSLFILTGGEKEAEEDDEDGLNETESEANTISPFLAEAYK
jgi:hypothetical protein